MDECREMRAQCSGEVALAPPARVPGLHVWASPDTVLSFSEHLPHLETITTSHASTNITSLVNDNQFKFWTLYPIPGPETKPVGDGVSLNVDFFLKVNIQVKPKLIDRDPISKG